MQQQLPEKFVQHIKELLGEEAHDFFASIEHPVEVSIRLNPLKETAAFIDTKPVAWSKWGRLLPKRPSFVADPLFHAGAYYVQEASSMFLEWVFQQIRGEDAEPMRVLDLCAAPGGKSTLLLSLMKDDDLLVTNEIIKSRVNILEENVMRWGRSNVVVTNNDPEQLGKLKHYFDVIVVDAPCSGEGMFRKDKKAIEEWSEEHVKLCSIRQQRILADVIPALKPGGFLIYSTCTFNTAENEDNVSWLMDSFNLTSVAMPIPDQAGIQTTSQWKDKALHAYRFYLHKVKGEGLFMACLQKNDQPIEHPTKRKETKVDRLTQAQLEIIKPWINDQHLGYFQYKQQLYACPLSLTGEMHFLQEHLHVRLKGLNIGEILKGKLVPNHQLALSVHLNHEVAKIPVNKEEALLFLKRESFPVPVLPQGIYLVTYQSIGLGWVKIMPNRMNNYLPIHWRILKPIQELLSLGAN